MNENLLKLLGNNEALYPHELDKQFPRIMHRIMDLWGKPDIETYFTELMLDRKDSAQIRQGFPTEVVAELYRLSQEHDRIMRKNATEEDNPWAHVDDSKQQEIEELGLEWSPQGFLKSAEDNNDKAVRLYLSAGFPLETRDERGWTPLMISSFNGNENMAELLIRSGANVHATDNGGYGPMHWAAYNGYANVIKQLIVKHADVNARNQNGWTPLLQGATRGHLAACGALIAGGANVNLASKDGWTPLHKACANGHIEVVKLLLGMRADRNAKYQDGTTPMDIAAKNKRQDIVELLKQ
jgi:ankyrin repeat protein